MNANYNTLSCQLGGLTLNGNIQNGTAQNSTVLSINDPSAIFDSSGHTIIDTSGALLHTQNFIKIKIGSEFYYLPVYQFSN
jgi:hypothetical protein